MPVSLEGLVLRSYTRCKLITTDQPLVQVRWEGDERGDTRRKERWEEISSAGHSRLPRPLFPKAPWALLQCVPNPQTPNYSLSQTVSTVSGFR